MTPSQHNNYCNIESIRMVQRTKKICNLCCKNVIRNKRIVILIYLYKKFHLGAQMNQCESKCGGGGCGGNDGCWFLFVFMIE
jgi:hypothetical protein